MAIRTVSLNDVIAARKMLEKRADEFNNGMATWDELMATVKFFTLLFDEYMTGVN